MGVFLHALRNSFLCIFSNEPQSLWVNVKGADSFYIPSLSVPRGSPSFRILPVPGTSPGKTSSRRGSPPSSLPVPLLPPNLPFHLLHLRLLSNCLFLSLVVSCDVDFPLRAFLSRLQNSSGSYFHLPVGPQQLLLCRAGFLGGSIFTP